MTTTICGYIVVRFPVYSRLEVEGRPPGPAPVKAGKSYEGLDRLAWEDLALGHYAKQLPPGLEQLWQQVHAGDNDGTGIRLLRRLRDAQDVLAFSNREEPRNEIIACYSPALARSKGSFQAGSPMTRLGYDVYSFGHWSLVMEGVFIQSALESWLPRLNEHGLLADPSQGPALADDYVAASQREEVEDLWMGDEGSLDFPEVFRLA